jgi:hypothetical protein
MASDDIKKILQKTKLDSQRDDIINSKILSQIEIVNKKFGLVDMNRIKKSLDGIQVNLQVLYDILPDDLVLYVGNFLSDIDADMIISMIDYIINLDLDLENIFKKLFSIRIIEDTFNPKSNFFNIYYKKSFEEKSTTECIRYILEEESFEYHTYLHTINSSYYKEKFNFIHLIHFIEFEEPNENETINTSLFKNLAGSDPFFARDLIN